MELSIIEAELRIQNSGVRTCFTPHQPILARDLFYGRKDEIVRIIEALSTPGQHVLLFGERGVGKSSLAYHVRDQIKDLQTRFSTITLQCDSGTDFNDIAKRTFSQFRAESQLTVPLTATDRYEALEPPHLADAISSTQGLLLIDEVDSIRKPEVRRQIASLMKILSDRGSLFKVLAVGVAETSSGLTDGHPSVSRCLRDVKLEGMSDDEIRQIVARGSERARLIFTEPLISRIVRMSGGYPHFAHLLALKCAEAAIRRSVSTVSLEHLTAALPGAARDAEASLAQAYNNATRSSTDMYEKVLVACVAVEKIEFTAAELRRAYHRVYSETLMQASLNNYLKILVGDGAAKILRRMRKGVYRFNDPRMMSYIRIAAGFVEEEGNNIAT